MEFDSQSGKMKWQMETEFQAAKRVSFEYEVKYPRKEKVILE
jgi:hypothetical protein